MHYIVTTSRNIRGLRAALIERLNAQEQPDQPDEQPPRPPDTPPGCGLRGAVSGTNNSAQKASEACANRSASVEADRERILEKVREQLEAQRREKTERGQLFAQALRTLAEDVNDYTPLLKPSVQRDIVEALTLIAETVLESHPR